MAKVRKLSSFEREDYRRLSYNMKRRFGRISSRYGEKSPALKRFNEKGGFFGVRGHTEEEIAKNYSLLRYLDSLKSSTVSGTRKAMEFDAKMDTIEIELGQDGKDMLWKLYSNLIEENGIASKYKYEVLDFIGERLVQGMGEDEIAQRLRDMADTWSIDGSLDDNTINPFDVLL